MYYELKKIISIANLGAKFLPIAVCAPLIAQISNDYGVFWYLLQTFFLLSAIGDFGLNAVSTRQISLSMGQAENERCQLVQSLSLLYRYHFIGYLLMITISGVYIFDNPKFENIDNIRIIYLSVFLFSSLNILSNKYISLLHASGNIITAHLIQLVSNLIMLIVSYLCLSNELYTIGIIISFAWPLMSMPLLSKYYNRSLREFAPNIKNFTFSTNSIKQHIRHNIFSQVWRTGLGSLFQLGTTHLISILASIMLDAKSALVIMFYMQIVRGISSVSQVMFFNDLTNIQREFSKEPYNKYFLSLSNRRIKLACLLYILAGLCSILVIYLYQYQFVGVRVLNIELLLIILIALLFERLSAYYGHIFALSGNINFHLIFGLGAISLIIVNITLQITTISQSMILGTSLLLSNLICFLYSYNKYRNEFL